MAGVGVREIIEDRDTGTECDQRVAEVSANEARTAGHADLGISERTADTLVQCPRQGFMLLIVCRHVVSHKSTSPLRPKPRSGCPNPLFRSSNA